MEPHAHPNTLPRMAAFARSLRASYVPDMAHSVAHETLAPREQPEQPKPAGPRPAPADDRRTDDRQKPRPGEQVKGEPNRRVRPQ